MCSYVRLTHKVGRDVCYELRLRRIVDQLGPHVGQADLSCRAKGCGNARSSASHAFLD
jgi:hypothetical protein